MALTKVMSSFVVCCTDMYEERKTSLLEIRQMVIVADKVKVKLGW